MKQVLHSYRTGELTVAEVPMPAAEPGALLVRTGASLVSAGTEKMALDLGKRSMIGKAKDRPDLVRKTLDKIQRDGLAATARTVVARLDEPVPLGYSCAGTILQIGRGVEGYQPGQRVACAGAKLANHAEVNSVPFRLCAHVPAGVTDDEAAFVTVGAIALQGVRTAAVALGESVAVVGLGLIGQLTVRILRAAGCKVLGIDLDPAKLELALAGGASAAVLRSGGVHQAVAALSDGRGMDSVIICAAATSNDPIELAGEIARDRGRVVVVGAVPMELPRRPFYDKELSLLLSRSYGPGRYDPAYEEQGRDYPAAYVRWTEERNFGAFLELCRDRRVDVRPLISHRFPIERAGEAYRLLSGESREPYLGIVLTYPEREVARTVSLGTAGKGRAAGSVRLGFAGAGAFAGSVLVPAFARVKRARLGTIVSARGISARHLGLRFGFSDASTSFEDLCADGALDGVVISTRHNLHAAQTVAALEAGKHVFVEKPMALTREEVDSVRAAAARSGKILLVGFNRRFAPLSRKLSGFFEERRSPLAMSYRVNAGTVPSTSWIQDRAVGGGRIVGEVCHFVDLLSFLAGAPPVRVQAVAAGSSGPDPQLIATLAFGDGSIGTIVYGGEGDPAYPKERLEVLGDGRIAVLDDYRSLEMSAGGKRSYARSLSQDKGHGEEAEAFVEAVAGGTSSPISLDSLCATSLATFAIEDAIRTGDTVAPASLPESGGGR
jgi:predicted dehydrogenase/threonine dehydrogenase-like Zn-dependent dehydrogenase